MLLWSMILIGNLSHSQSLPENNTLISKELDLKNLSYFIAPTFGLTNLDGSSASIFQVRGGVGSRALSFGGYFQTNINEVIPQSETEPNIYLEYWSAGGFIEYTLFSDKVFHMTFPLYIGYGEVDMDNEAGNINLGEANFFQVEPSALLEVNLTDFARLNIGGGYRFVGNMSYRNFNQSDISGLTGYVGLKVGLFR